MHAGMTHAEPSGLITQCPGALIWWLEDDRALCKLVTAKLQKHGWQLQTFHHLKPLQLSLQQDEPDLILLDLHIPGEDARTALQLWRQQGLSCPVLILSGLASASDRVDGLAAGANDYLVKPFHLKELTWRIEHLLVSSRPRRLRSPAVTRPIQLGPLTVEPGESSLRNADGEVFRLTRGELALLLALLSQPNVVHPRNALLHSSGSLVDTATSRTLDVRLSRLRRLLQTASAGSVGITSVRGRGYRLSLTTGNRNELGTCQPLAIAALLPSLTRPWAPSLTASRAGLLLLALSAALSLTLCWRRWIPGWFTGLRLRHCKPQLSAQQQNLLHDLRAPLTRLWLRADELPVNTAPERELVTALRADLHLMTGLIDALDDKGCPRPRHASVRTTDLHRLLTGLLVAYPVGSVQIDVPALELSVDTALLSQALHNLIDNAIEHGSPPVSLSTEQQATGVVLILEEVGERTSGTAPLHRHPGSGLGVVLDYCQQAQATLEFRPQASGALQIRLGLGHPEQPSADGD